ncbi:MoaD/ThiS family protein [Luteibacter sp. PPL201]|uniref:MoaD/ThiS family protein n=1 Tax=Luteibacter sahnii TaxID=3021977 RepID=A0ABT6BAD4_9GAMM|nr:MoaD/ThiS family protein [Luteibacter sp. PPL193]MDY1547029.1 MoaD/ThiS family protein [Luteibacter sp. PPL193]
MTTIVFEFYASLERLAGTREFPLDVGDAHTVGDALLALDAARPDLAERLARCACAAGDAIVRRHDPLPADGRIALLPPVAGG